MRSFHTLRRYWQLLARYLRPQRLRMGLLALPLSGSIAVQVATPLLASRFIDRATASAGFGELIILALLTVGLALVGQGLAVAETYLAEQVSWSATNALRADLLAHLLRLEPAFHTAHTPGELIERADGDVATLARFFSRFVVSILGNGALIVGVLGLLLFVDWRVGLGLSSFVVLALIVMLRIRAAATPLWAAERQASADFYGFLGDYLSGLEDVRSSGAGAFVLRRCAEVMRSGLAATRSAQLLGYALVATSQGLFALGTIVAFAVSALLFNDGALTIGTVYLIFRYTEMLRQPTEQIRNEMQDLQQADASIGRIEALLDTQPRLADEPGEELPSGPLALELDGVSFGYTEDVLVLRDVSLRVEPGRVLGVVGRTGSGKTTLTRLLPRFYDPLAGTVRLGSVDLRAVGIAALRVRVGLVGQEVQLFNRLCRRYPCSRRRQGVRVWSAGDTRGRPQLTLCSTAASRCRGGRFMRPLPTWRYTLNMARYAPWLYLLHALLWSVMNLLSLLPGLIARAFFDTLTGAARLPLGIAGLLGLFGILAVGRAALWLFAGFVEIAFRFRMSGLLRRNLLRLVLALPGARALPFSIGETISRFRDDAYEAEDNMDWTDEIISHGLFAAVAFAILLHIDVTMALVVILPMVAVTAIAQRASAALARYRSAGSAATSQVTEAIGDIVAAVPTLQAAGAEARVMAHFRRLNERRRNTTAQVPRLFNETLKQNILLGLPDDPTLLAAAVRAAVLDHDVQALDAGLETRVGSGGVKLSGGQVQHLAFANSFAGNASSVALREILIAVLFVDDVV